MDQPPDLRPEDYLRFVVVDPFQGQWSRLKLGEEVMQALEISFLVELKAGVVVSGAGGLRKRRFSAPASGKGKSG